MSNLYQIFKSLVGESPRLYGTVSVTDSAGALVDLPDGGQVRAVGDVTVGDKVFVRGGVIEGPAPSLTLVSIEI